MGRAKTQIKKVSVVSKDDTDSLNRMFEQMTGISNADSAVIIPKILKIKQRVVKYHKLFMILCTFKELHSISDDLKHWAEEIRQFITSLVSDTGTEIGGEYSPENVDQVRQLQSKSDDELNAIYKGLKESKYIKEIVITCSNLSEYKRHLSEKKSLDDRFIEKEPGLALIPFSFSGLDLKMLWELDEMTPKYREFIISILHHAYTVGLEIYDIVSGPDIDINKFSTILVESITKLRKQIPRCDKAFDVIENSVKLLENNFKSYYRNSIEAENPSIIVESFIIDVSTSQNASPLVTSQFRKIVAFLKQRSAGISDPKIKKLFGMLGNQFTAMDRESGVPTADPENPLAEELQSEEPIAENPLAETPLGESQVEPDESQVEPEESH